MPSGSERRKAQKRHLTQHGGWTHNKRGPEETGGVEASEEGGDLGETKKIQTFEKEEGDGRGQGDAKKRRQSPTIGRSDDKWRARERGKAVFSERVTGRISGRCKTN